MKYAYDMFKTLYRTMLYFRFDDIDRDSKILYYSKHHTQYVFNYNGYDSQDADMFIIKYFNK